MRIKSISAEEFRMWRALFAFSIVDGVLSIEEQTILSKHLSDKILSEKQRHILQNDIKYPQDVEAMFGKIESKTYKKKFCELARTLVWCDGDITRQEKEILNRIACLGKKVHQSILSNSGKTAFIKRYADEYEKIQFMKTNVTHPLFKIAA